MDKQLAELANKVRVFFCDSDGVMFPNTVWMGAPFKAKYRSYYDGQGISLLRAVGIRVVFITSEKNDAAAAIRESIEKWNQLPSSKSLENPQGWEHVILYEGFGSTKKLESAKEFLDQNNLTLDSAAYMGDDLVDIALLQAVALPAAPASAEEAIKKICRFVSSRDGGEGAVRDFANMILEIRGIDPFTLPAQ